MPLLKAGALSLDDVIKIQQDRVRTADYQALGQAIWFSFERAKDAAAPAKVMSLHGLRMDFQSQGPQLGVSHDGKDLLICGPVADARGKVGLPDIPDPDWIPAVPTQSQLDDKNWKQPRARIIAQRFEDLASGQFKANDNSLWLVFQPMAQVIFRPLQRPTFATITCEVAPWDSTHMALLLNPQTGEAHFVGGRFSVGGAPRRVMASANV
jgi:hypothetical protein